jgi:amino acid permease
MSYLGFTGNENRILTKLLQRRSRLDVPWVAVWMSSLLGILAFMTASNDVNASPQYVYFFLRRDFNPRSSSFS